MTLYKKETEKIEFVAKPEVHIAAVGVVSRNTRDGGTVALKSVQNTCKTRAKGEK